MKTGICWRCSSRGRLENYLRAKPLRDWAWLKYCERPPLAESGHRRGLARSTWKSGRAPPSRYVSSYCHHVIPVAELDRVGNLEP